MSITKEVKKDLISKFSINEKDTGSAEVQIAVQTERINNLIEHFKNTFFESNEKFLFSRKTAYALFPFTFTADAFGGIWSW